MKRRFLGSVLALLALAACATDVGGDDDASEEADITRKPEYAQMNDVSVLYPLAKTKAEFAGYLSASATGSRGKLFPDQPFLTATGHERTRPTGGFHPGAEAGLYYDELRVVGMRIDPCFANLGPITNPAACKNQLRLVLQPLRFEAGATGMVDGAVHAFYAITRDELVALVKSLVALRREQTQATNLGALAVHPILTSQGLLGNEAKGLSALILKYAGKNNLTRFTTLAPGNLATRWDFAGFDVAAGVAKPMKIPKLPGQSTNVSFFAGFASDLAGGFTPETNAPAADNMQLLGNFTKAEQATPAKRQAAFDAALRIENPTMHSPDTIDCASCHVAGPGRVLTGEKLGLSATGNANAFKPDAKYVTKGDMKQTTPVNASTNRNFHAFSYRDGHAMIAMRVVNETASIVAYLNGNILNHP